MLGRLWVERKHQLVGFSEIEEPMRRLLNQFHRSKRQHTLENPFKRLRTDGAFWELSNVSDLPDAVISDLSVTEIRRRGVCGGFTAETVEFLVKHPVVILELARALLQRHFPESFFADICAMVDLPYPIFAEFELNLSYADVDDCIGSQREYKRDSSFRERVLDAYQRRCAFCGSVTKLRNEPIDLEAAHIKWHSHGGPDDVANGLALCVAHHKLFDRGALGLEHQSTSYQIVFARSLNSFGPFDDLLRKIRGSSMQVPFDRKQWPSPEFVQWHWNQVFQGL